MQVHQQTTNTDDFQEIGHEEKEALKRKYSMDDALENKICDLYDLHVEVMYWIFVYLMWVFPRWVYISVLLQLQRLEEDSGPPVRRLYEEVYYYNKICGLCSWIYKHVPR